MGRTAVIEQRELGAGRTDFAPRSIEDAPPGQVTVLVARMARCTSATPNLWPDPEPLKLAIEVSFDGGATWFAAGACAAFGGVHVRRDGTEATHTELRAMIPRQRGVERLVRGYVESEKGTRVEVDVEELQAEDKRGRDEQLAKGLDRLIEAAANGSAGIR